MQNFRRHLLRLTGIENLWLSLRGRRVGRLNGRCMEGFGLSDEEQVLDVLQNHIEGGDEHEHDDRRPEDSEAEAESHRDQESRLYR